MKTVRYKGLPTEQLVQEYRAASAAHGHATEAGSSKEANRAYDLVLVIRQELSRRGMEAQRQLLPLLQDPEPGTRCMAASDVLAFAPEEAVPVLEALASVLNSLVGFTARMNLRQWKEGAFRPP